MHYFSNSLVQVGVCVDKIDGLNTVSAANFVKFGTVASLNLSHVQQILTATAFVAKAGVTFTLSKDTDEQTFLAVNDNTNRFFALTDAVIGISRYKGNLTNLAIL